MGLSACHTEKLRSVTEHLKETVVDKGSRPRDPLGQHQVDSKPRQPRKRLTEARRKQLAQEYEDGVSTARLAKKYGLARSTVTLSLKASGVRLRKQRRMTEIEVDEMRCLRQSGMSLVAIAERLGVHEKTVWNYLREKRCMTLEPLVTPSTSVKI